MDERKIRALLRAIKKGKINIDEAVQHLRTLPFEGIDFAHIDHHRHLRQGFPEVIFGEGKSAEQIVKIIEKMAKHGDNILATRISPEKASYIKKTFSKVKYYPTSRVLTFTKHKIKVVGKGIILVISAGTSDIPVAEEALITAQMMGNKTQYMYDVGVAGIHRLLHHKHKVLSASVLIVVAGMEGALPSVVSGMVDKPVIAVPTSVGYGSSFGGLAALLSMLNACASGVAVVNIDNGFGAGYVASLINRV